MTSEQPDGGPASEWKKMTVAEVAPGDRGRARELGDTAHVGPAPRRARQRAGDDLVEEAGIHEMRGPGDAEQPGEPEREGIVSAGSRRVHQDIVSLVDTGPVRGLSWDESQRCNYPQAVDNAARG